MRKRLLLGLFYVFVIGIFLICSDGVIQASEPVLSIEKSSEEIEYTWLIKPKYESALPFSEELWGVEQNGFWGYVDSADNVVIGFLYSAITEFQNGIANVQVNKYENGVINNKGEYLITPRSDIKETAFISNLVAFKSGTGKYGFLNLSGDIQIEAGYENVRHFSEGKAAVASGDRWGAIDTKGNWIIQPQYKMLGAFWNGYIPFKTDADLWGLLDTKGNVLLEPRYTDISPSFDHSGPILVRQEGKINYLDETLTPLLSPDYDARPQGLSYFETYDGGGAFVYDRGIFKVLNPKGGVMFRFSPMAAEPIFISGRGGYFVLRSNNPGKTRNKCFLVNKKGAMVLPPEFEYIIPAIGEVIAVRQNGLWGLVLLKKSQ